MHVFGLWYISRFKRLLFWYGQGSVISRVQLYQKYQRRQINLQNTNVHASKYLTATWENVIPFFSIVTFTIHKLSKDVPTITLLTTSGFLWNADFKARLSRSKQMPGLTRSWVVKSYEH